MLQCVMMCYILGVTDISVCVIEVSLYIDHVLIQCVATVCVM